MLEVIYLIFNEGYAATAGEDLIRPALCAEAQRLGRILAGLAPDEPEVFGLLALMEIQASRLAARTAPDGSLGSPDRTEPRPLGPAPDPPRPRRPGARRGAGRRRRALRPAGRARRLPCAGAQGGGDGLEEDRGALRHAARGHAVAGGRSQSGRGPQHGLRPGGRPDARRRDRRRPRPCATMRPLPAAKGDFLFRAGRLAEARVEFERAAALTRNEREKAFLLGRAAACGG